MITNYAPFVERMIQRYEGGYGWDRNDPGGPTKYGITCYDLAEHLHEKMNSMAYWAPIVMRMTLGTADQIYADKYATACAFTDLGPGKDCVVFDFGVNSGPSRAIRAAQHLTRVAADGIMGPVTLAAINAYQPATFINDYCALRLRFLEGLGIWSTFGKGWAARVADLRAYAQRLLTPQRPKALLATHQPKPIRIPLAFAKGWELEAA